MIRFTLADDRGFVRGMMYANDIWMNLDIQIYRYYWSFVTQLYISHDKYLLDYSISKILKYMSDLSKEFIKKKGKCCDFHLSKGKP